MPSAERESLRWLDRHGGDARRFVHGAVAAGAAQAMATIGLMYVLAWVLHSVVIERSLAAAPQWALMAMPTLVVLRAGMALLRDECGVRAGQSARQSLRAALLDAAYRGGPLWRGGVAGGALSSVVTDQVDAVDGYFARYRPQQLLAALIPILILAAVLPHSWMAALILLGTAPLIPLFMVMIGWRTRAEQSRQMLAMQRLGGAFLDLVRGLPTLRLFAAGQRSLDELAARGELFRIRTMKVLRLAFLSGTVLEFFTSLAIALSAVFLGFSLLGYLDFGFFGEGVELRVALFILLLAPEFYQPLRELGTHYHARAEALAAGLEIRRILDSAPAAREGELRPDAGIGPARLHLDRLGLAYREGVPVLQDCCLSLAPGECVGIVGPSGSGKSSLLRLAAGIVLPTEGVLRIDGVDAVLLDRPAWREQIGWMDQHPPLLAASLAANLLVARSDAETAALWSALEFAGLKTWAEALPAQLDTVLGEGGRQLSGGQLRRLALARLALKRPRLLLLDEPTASLDEAAEAFVIERLRHLCAPCTTLLVTHRPGPLQLCGRVLTLEQGRLLSATASAVSDLTAMDCTEANPHG